MGAQDPKAKGRSVLVVLMKGDEADATISVIRRDQPDAKKLGGDVGALEGRGELDALLAAEG